MGAGHRFTLEMFPFLYFAYLFAKFMNPHLENKMIYIFDSDLFLYTRNLLNDFWVQNRLLNFVFFFVVKKLVWNLLIAFCYTYILISSCSSIRSSEVRLQGLQGSITFLSKVNNSISFIEDFYIFYNTSEEKINFVYFRILLKIRLW